MGHITRNIQYVACDLLHDSRIFIIPYLDDDANHIEVDAA